MTFCFGLYQDLVNLLWKIIIYFSKKCFSFMILKELISLKHRFSKHFVNNKYLIQKSFITLYLSNIIAICDWKQFYLFSKSENKNFYKYLSTTHICPTPQLGNNRCDIHTGHIARNVLINLFTHSLSKLLETIDVTCTNFYFFDFWKEIWAIYY